MPSNELVHQTGTAAAAAAAREPADGEEEWDDSTARATTATSLKQQKTSNLTAAKSNDDVAEAMLDRTHLCIVRALVSDLHIALSLVEKDVDNVKKDKKAVTGDAVSSAACMFPLNQMTWPELVRMSLILKLYEELEKSEEEVRTLYGICISVYHNHFHFLLYRRLMQSVEVSKLVSVPLRVSFEI